MDREHFWSIVENLETHYGSITTLQKEDYYNHLKHYTDAELTKASFVVLETHRYKRFPLIPELREILDKIRFDARSEPTADEAKGFYDQFPCTSCGGTGYIIKENPAYKPGESAATTSFCQCDTGARRKDGWDKYRQMKQEKGRLNYDRRFEPEEES